MKKPGTFYRKTLAELDEIPDISGIYVLAYMGRVVYVGKAELSVHDRLANHCTNALYEPLGAWMRQLEADWTNVRLDVLGLPEGEGNHWLSETEAALIHRFGPLFNTHLLPAHQAAVEAQIQP